MFKAGRVCFDRMRRDSRGVCYNDGDMVMCLGTKHNSWEVSICVYSMEDNSLIDLDSKEFYDYYIRSVFIKLRSYTEESYTTYASQYILGDSLISYISHIEDDYFHKHKSYKGFGLRDMLGRALKPGSLVLYSGEKTISSVGEQWSYGVVISDTELFTEHLNVISARHVLLIEPADFIDYEKTLYKNLSMLYRQKAITSTVVSANGGYKIGDIYRCDDIVYVFLGKCRMVCEVPAESNILFDYKHDETKEYWVKIGKLSMGGIYSLLSGDRNSINLNMQKVFRDCMVEKTKYYINDSLYAMYKRVTNFNLFCESLPDSAVYVGNMQMYSFFEKDNAVANNELWNFKLRLELLSATKEGGRGEDIAWDEILGKA